MSKPKPKRGSIVEYIDVDGRRRAGEVLQYNPKNNSVLVKPLHEKNPKYGATVTVENIIWDTIVILKEIMRGK